MNMIAKHGDTKSNYHNLVDCQESRDGQQWLSCDGVVTVPEGRVFDDDLRHQICFIEGVEMRNMGQQGVLGRCVSC